MKKSVQILFGMSVLLLSGVLSAQRINQPPTPTLPSILSKPSLSGFLDMSKFKMKHSYSMSLTSFGGGNNFTEGMYTNTIFYKFDAPAVLRMDLGIIHDPFNTQTFGNNSNNAQFFLKNLSLEYKPWQNTTLYVGFRQQPYSVSNYFNSYNRNYRSIADPFYDFTDNGW